MTEAGLAKVVEAKKNGQWEAASLREQVDVVQRKQWLYWKSTAKRPETKAKRIDAIVTAVVASAEGGRTNG